MEAGASEDELELVESPVGGVEEQLHEIEQELQLLDAQIASLMERQEQLQTQRAHLRKQLEQQQEAQRPKHDWEKEAFAWDQTVARLLKDVFKLSTWRPLQREVINATLQGHDVLCLLPSGMGKSLCYQLPALVDDHGVTLVVSPLLSLIQDQVLGLNALNIRAAALTSHTPKEEANATLAALGVAGSTARLVYLTPEKIVASKRLMSKLEKLNQAGNLSRIVVDEAHCCSAWGNDFRRDYKKLAILKQQYPKVPLMALTATATSKVCEDLKSILRIPHAETFKHSINRPNLYYEVQQRETMSMPELADEIVTWVRSHYPGKETGIVYCLTRKDCEQLTQELNKGGVITARCYHADMEVTAREAAHRDWLVGKVQVVVATIAFGMGVNHTKVRFVVHASISKSIENYYQESGRAGRDGLPARCLLMYCFSDVMRQAAIVCMESNWSSNLHGIGRYAANVGRCRRAVIQEHFAEPAADCRGTCDICASQVKAQRVDVTPHVFAILRALQAMGNPEKRATLIQLVDAWRKGKQADTEAAKAARAMSRQDCKQVIADMLFKGLLQLDFGFTAYTTNTYLKASDRGLTMLALQPGAAKLVFLERMPNVGQLQHGQQGRQEGHSTAADATVSAPVARRSGEQGGSGKAKAKQPARQQRKSGTRKAAAATPLTAAVAASESKQVVVLDSDSGSDEFMDAPASKRKKAS